MASAVVKMAVLCLLLLSVGQLMASATARPDNDEAAQLRLKDRLELQEEEALALTEELALLDDGAGDDGAGDDVAVGACTCNHRCKRCVAKCGFKCVRTGTFFPACFLRCVFTTRKCFA